MERKTGGDERLTVMVYSKRKVEENTGKLEDVAKIQTSLAAGDPVN